MRIWIDDLRDPKNYGFDEAVWVKNSLDYKLLLIDCLIKDDGDSVKAIHFDNDLGEETEGYDLFLIVEEALHKGKLKGLEEIYVHSSNPSAVHKFMLAARGLKYYFNIDLIRQQY